MATTIATRPALAASTPVRLFRLPFVPSAAAFTTFDVHPDGRRFVVQVPVADVQPPITVILNWQALLK